MSRYCRVSCGRAEGGKRLERLRTGECIGGFSAGREHRDTLYSSALLLPNISRQYNSDAVKAPRTRGICHAVGPNIYNQINYPVILLSGIHEELDLIINWHSFPHLNVAAKITLLIFVSSCCILYQMSNRNLIRIGAYSM